MMSNVWFDRENVTPVCTKHNDSMEEMCQEVDKMIDVEVENGIPRDRVILGIFFIPYYCLCNFPLEGKFIGILQRKFTQV